MQWSVDVIMKTIGLPSSNKYYKKFLLKRNQEGKYIMNDGGAQLSFFDVETTCLLPTDGHEDVRIQS